MTIAMRAVKRALSGADVLIQSFGVSAGPESYSNRRIFSPTLRECWSPRVLFTFGQKRLYRCSRQDDGQLLRQQANSDSIKPAAFGRKEQAFSSLRRVLVATRATERFFPVWPHGLRGIRPLLAVPLAAAVPFS